MVDLLILTVAVVVLILFVYEICKIFYTPEDAALRNLQFKFRRSKILHWREIEAVKPGCNLKCTRM